MFWDTANPDRRALRRVAASESELRNKSIMVLQVPNRRDCEELCLSETSFVCLSADYNIVTLSCALRYYLTMENNNFEYLNYYFFFFIIVKIFRF
jgi:hypothetical protein